MHTLLDRNTSGKFLILVEVDFSENGFSVLQSAADLAAATAGSELHLVHAFGPAIRCDGLRWFPALSDITPIEDCDTAGEALHRIAASIRLQDTRVCAHVHEGSPTTVIARLAEELAADLVVIGNHDRRGLYRAVFGSVAERLVRMAPCPVLIIRSKSAPSIEPLAPICAACEATKRLTWGAHIRCLDHAHYPGERRHGQTPSAFDLGAEAVSIH